ncbi:conserved Plasmodium protein, unknown function [Plasmodium knowlesi strain H]|uniref:Uncharacterized protein n=3 Tax=Plasmodium knowlesi TaxID=5850 RepID=A0A1A7VSB9_PLAKH|nr:conserved Plasmodium protein, unknown function [Plasmodium knowlesi strain H]OTN65510.1 Uncharacterized protein PKNOH_S110076900 [Plasmodium knowlesi]CAA9989390.1 conserved Plasmodium protein, unknown function [Plasmodium knowlesi strain H]SBO24984.1 conserved Plasmodium protein, unknown function [Plasmodium knowlesi strain H]SBO27882.1 conserved Plasmodium protein, unknown function [Plasmodium knowlesi strain H]VVS78864.1 conserved Plasmodium protein, unknown function [Plasmodium knowlesi 
MEYTPNEEKTTDYLGLITNLLNYFSLGIDDKVTPEKNSSDMQKASMGRNPHARNSIQQVVYNLKLKRTSELRISPRFGLDTPAMQNRKGFEKKRQEEDNASISVLPSNCKGGENTRDNSAENCLNRSGEIRKKKKQKKKNAKNRDKQYTSSFDFSGGEFFQLKEQSEDEGEEESKVEESKEERKKKREKRKDKGKKKKKKSKREEEEEKTIEAVDAEENAEDPELEPGVDETRGNIGCGKTDEGDEPHREQEAVNYGENETRGADMQEDTKKKKKVKKVKKKKTRGVEMKVNETISTENDSAENGPAPIEPTKHTSERTNTYDTGKGNHNAVRKKKSTTLNRSFVQPPCRSNSDQANVVHVVDEADSQRNDFVKAQDELGINYISDCKKSYISIRSSNKGKDDVIQLPKLNLSTRGSRSSSGEENETTDEGDVLTPLEDLHQ